MKIANIILANIILPALLCLVAVPALAQEPNNSGKQNPGELSDQEYQAQRAKILMRMNATSPQTNQQSPKEKNAAKAEPAVKEKPVPGGSYGQGYDSRKNTKDANARDAANSRPDIEISRPERPQVQIDRPGRP